MFAIMDREIQTATLNINQLAGITDMHRQTIAARLKDVPLAPGSNAKLKLYKIQDILKHFLDAEPPAEPEDVSKMKPGERLSHYRAENERIKLETDTAELIRAEEVVREYAALAKAVIQVLETLPDVLERDCALSPQAVSRVQETIDDLRDQMADKVMACDEIQMQLARGEEAEEA